jgi:glutathione S-transferase
MPADADRRRKVLQIVGVALIAMEKTVALIYETRQRAKELQHKPGVVRVEQQLAGGVHRVRDHVGAGGRWLAGPELTQADVSVAVAIRFLRHIRPEALPQPECQGLARFSERAEALPEFLACPFD